jgi:DNA/RNA endonuclease G (NUC1)
VAEGAFLNGPKGVFLVCFIQQATGQTIKHHAYTTYYNAAKGEPDSVSWDLTPAMVGCGTKTRINKFAQDPSIPNSTGKNDYAGSGYDKGHLFNWDDAKCNPTDDKECFYMSNMLPQPHSLNAGDWGTLEKQERCWAATQTIHIIAGGYGTKGKLASGVNIPESCWKAIYVDGKWHGYVFPNEATSKGHKSYSYWEVMDIKRFDSIVGLNL